MLLHLKMYSVGFRSFKSAPNLESIKLVSMRSSVPCRRANRTDLFVLIMALLRDAISARYCSLLFAEGRSAPSHLIQTSLPGIARRDATKTAFYYRIHSVCYCILLYRFSFPSYDGLKKWEGGIHLPLMVQNAILKIECYKWKILCGKDSRRPNCVPKFRSASHPQRTRSYTKKEPLQIFFSWLGKKQTTGTNSFQRVLLWSLLVCWALRPHLFRWQRTDYGVLTLFGDTLSGERIFRDAEKCQIGFSFRKMCGACTGLKGGRC